MTLCSAIRPGPELMLGPTDRLERGSVHRDTGTLNHLSNKRGGTGERPNGQDHPRRNSIEGQQHRLGIQPSHHRVGQALLICGSELKLQIGRILVIGPNE
ncbi:MAG TPA: hypothetical protein DGG94_15090 [Micromonosporaceae bacterium]|nr:hypothetical protein [Micromonosporaceae bacterium]